MHCDLQYRNLAEKIIYEGHRKTSRGGAISSTRSLFGPQLDFNLLEGFPLLTTKKINFNYVYHELTAFLRGETTVDGYTTAEGKVRQGFKGAEKLWQPWANEVGDLGPIYGYQWRHWQDPNDEGCPIDQIKFLIEQLRHTPDSRRMVVSAWNPADLDRMALPPCHMMFQCYVYQKTLAPTRGIRNFLELHMYQRSADFAIGVPFNIASYALLTHMLAQECNMIPARLVISFGDCHVYEPHIENLKKQICREPKDPCPRLLLHQKDFWKRIEDNDPADFDLVDYSPHPFIQYGVEV
jgi:thymidylate synthase